MIEEVVVEGGDALAVNFVVAFDALVVVVVLVVVEGLH